MLCLRDTHEHTAVRHIYHLNRGLHHDEVYLYGPKISIIEVRWRGLLGEGIRQRSRSMACLLYPHKSAIRRIKSGFGSAYRGPNPMDHFACLYQQLKASFFTQYAFWHPR